ncbi:MAG: D-alanyl-D-alanine carboxypeptidase [Clostridiales bacterium]|nr:D-alanyl-D-alanine carboxypeptidase [Clostridiales bacterium]
MKKAFIILCITLLSISFILTPGKANAAEYDDIPFKYNVKSVLLMKCDNGEIIYAKNENEKVPIASITKVMTLILTFEAINSGVLSLDDKLTVSAYAASMGGSDVFLHEGETITVSDTLKAVIVASANDACVVLSEKICGSESVFVTKMNEKAAELGMKNTVFANCTGLPLPDTQAYSTAYDVSIMSNELLKHPEYFNYSTIWLDTLDNIRNKTIITNTNRLVRFYNGCDGLKTGYTDAAKHCITASASRNDMRFIAVILGASSSDERFEAAKYLLDYGFSNYKSIKIIEKGSSYDKTNEIPVRNGIKQTVCGVAAEDFTTIIKNTASSEHRISAEIYELKAPIAKNEVIGMLRVFENDKEITAIPIISTEDIEKMGYKDIASAMLKRLYWIK